MFNSIQSSLNQIETVTGKHWLHEQVEIIRDTDPRNRIGAAPDRRVNLIHPLAAAWLAGREELAMAELTGAAHFSERTASIARLGEILARCKVLQGFEKQIERLLRKNLYETACCELFAAYEYLVAGWNIKFDAPDLVINSPDGKPEEEITARNYFIPPGGSKNHFSHVENILDGIPDLGRTLVAWIHDKHDKHGDGSVVFRFAKTDPGSNPFVSAVVLAQYKRFPGSALSLPNQKVVRAVNDSSRYPLPPAFKKTFFQLNGNAPGS